METLHPKKERRLEKGIIYAKRNALLAELKALESTMPAVEVGENKAWWLTNLKWLIIGGLLILGIGFAAYKTTAHNQVEPIAQPATANRAIAQNEQLFKDYFEPLDDFVTTLGKEETSRQRAFEAYNSKDYESAIPLLEAWYKEEQNPMAYLYQGVSHLALDQANEAIERLELFKNKANNFHNEANWYLALAYLKKNNRPEVEKIGRILTANRKRQLDDILKQLEVKQ